MDKIVKILERLGVPFAYDHFAEGEGPDPPFVCFRYPDSDNFAADGTVYLDIDVVDIELYTDKKDPVLEGKLQRLLKEAGIFYGKNEVWIESERLYEVIYEFEEASNGEQEE